MPSNPASIASRIFPTAHRILLEKELRNVLPNLTGRILVVGAGHNPYGLWMSREASLVVTDVEEGLDGIDQVADVHALPFETDSFDAVLAVEVFEHLQFPMKAAAEILRVLRPGGRAVVTTPFLFHVHGDPMDFARFTKAGLKTLFSSYGEVTVLEYGGRPHVISDLVTTIWRPLALLRVINHLLARGPLSRLRSNDSPSGYVLVAAK